MEVSFWSIWALCPHWAAEGRDLRRGQWKRAMCGWVTVRVSGALDVQEILWVRV